MYSFKAFGLRRILRHLLSLAFDLSIAAIAFLAAFMTIYSHPRILTVPAIDDKLLGFMVSSLAAFLVFKPYRSSWRYVSVPDLITIMKAAVLAVAIYTVGAFFLTRGENIPRSVPVLALVYMVMGLAGARLCYRIVLENLARLSGAGSVGDGDPSRAVLLCGLSGNAESFIRSTRRHAPSPVSIAGIIDDSPINLGRTVQGVTVLGSLESLDKVLARLKRRRIEVKEIVVTEPSVSRRRLAYILECANSLSIKVSRIPDITDTAMVTSDLLLEPRPIELEDLLGRSEVRIDLGNVAQLIENKVVLVTGAGGSIGSELSRQIAALRPRSLIITDSSEFQLYKLDTELHDNHPRLELVARILDVRERHRVMRLLAHFRPQVVFHAAALKHVPLMEDNPLEAVKTNLLGTRNVADAALASQATTFVMISTDKAVNPTNIMGATKRAAEAYCQAEDMSSTHTRFKTVRFGNVLGSNGSVVPRFQQQIAAGGPVTVTHPHIVRYFMTIPEAVRLVLHASAHALRRKAEPGRIMVLDMGKPVRIIDLAERMIQLAGYRPRVDIDIVFTGLRRGEKLYEELFDPSEVTEGRNEEGYVMAAPRVIDRHLLDRTISEIAGCAEREDAARALELLFHIVPEYRRPPAGETMTEANANIGANSAPDAKHRRIPRPAE